MMTKKMRNQQIKSELLYAEADSNKTTSRTSMTAEELARVVKEMLSIDGVYGTPEYALGQLFEATFDEQDEDEDGWIEWLLESTEIQVGCDENGDWGYGMEYWWCGPREVIEGYLVNKHAGAAVMPPWVYDCMQTEKENAAPW